ncbi:hypothetical protein DFH08DRAFT_1085316 [Mycena albidolilacea]|uniref:F-box domain-containing protein n=1 Tax=Mycena albidolilacea TaxID=1033008 RepID=A0AAD6ZIE0_9AGAR|nr:hypothetical protein DFH08DRAFT_1085316 [Mycena albidolilacea]
MKSLWEANAAIRSAIDQKIIALYDQIADMKEERNLVVPASIVPNEVLARIFGMAVETSDLCQQMLQLMLVCRRWYRVAVASPELWGDIHFWGAPSDRRLEAQLRLSGAVPLTICIGSLNTLAAANPVLAHATRLTSLTLNGISESISDFTQKMIPHHFPCLKALSLDSRNPDGADVYATLPLELLDGHLPNLEELSLVRIDAPFRSLPPLQSVCLRGGKNSPSRLSLALVLDCLQASPALHTLFLDMIILPPAQEGTRSVRLPHLTTLYLHEDVDKCTAVLNQLEFPATARLLLYPLGIEDNEDMDDLIIPIRKHLRKPGAPTPTQLFLEGPAPYDPEDSIFFTICVYGDSDSEALFSVNTHPAGSSARRRILETLLTALRAEDIAEIHIEAVLSPRSWKRMLPRLPAVRFVRICADRPGTQFLGSLLGSDDQLVTLRRISVRMRIYFKDEGERDAVTAAFMDALEHVLRAYHERGQPVEQLIFRDRYGKSQLVENKSKEWGDAGLVGEVLGAKTPTWADVATGFLD